jgi:hypothetical protein
MLLGVTVLAGGCVYRERGLFRSWGAGAWGGVRRGAGWVRGRASATAGAVVDAGRSLADAVNPF